jgi:hypothetical protein
VLCAEWLLLAGKFFREAGSAVCRTDAAI